MSHKSEEQWKDIGTCPICDSPLYLMDDKVKWHKCYDELESFVYAQPMPLNLQDIVKNIVRWDY